MNTETVTSNDVRRWVYEWFTMWEYRVPAERLVRHLAEDSLSLTFPGGRPLGSAAEFTAWYEALLENTTWNFHELSNLAVVATTGNGSPQFEVGFDVSWRGQTESASEWPTNLPDRGFRFEVYQTWKVVSVEGEALNSPFTITNLVATMA
jgi:hypothetical protein